MRTFRPQRVANVVRAVVGQAIAGKLSDPRIEVMTSVTRVEVSRDLEHAKVFVSVMGSSAVQRRTMEGLASARGFIQALVARELPIRQCPRVSFHLDASIKRAAETIRVIDETMAEYRASDQATGVLENGCGHRSSEPTDEECTDRSIEE